MNRPLVSAVIAEAAALAGMEPGHLVKHWRTRDEEAASRRAMWALRILRPDLTCAVLGVWFDRCEASVIRQTAKARKERATDPFERREQNLLMGAFTDGGDDAQAA